jgi:phage tail sheath protein FI
MPEYLAPAVYVEEVDTGTKPIEGVSTSTAGVVGVTERGPENVPILITSAGEFQRWFGQYLNPDEFGVHCYLPHAIEGFFTNGGKRIYVTRVIDTEAASRAHVELFREEPVVDPPVLLAPAASLATSVVISAPLTFAAGDSVRIGTGSDSEYRDPPVGATAASTTFIALHSPLQFSHANGATVEHYAAIGAVLQSLTLSGAYRPGATSVVLTGVGPVAVGQILRINTSATATNEELIYVADVGGTGTNWVVTLATPLQVAHANGEGVDTHAALTGAPVADQTTLTQAVQAGTLVPVVASNGVFGTLDELIVFVDGPRSEVRRIASLGTVTLGAPAYDAYLGGWRFEHFSRSDTAGVLTLDTAVLPGALTLNVDDRSTLNIGDVIRVGNDTDIDVEYAVIHDLPNQAATAPDPGRIVLEDPLRFAHGGVSIASRQIVAQQTLTNAGFEADTGSIVVIAEENEDTLILSNSFVPAAPTDELIAIVPPGGAPKYHRAAAGAALVPQTVTFLTPLHAPHDAGAPVVIRHSLLDVWALDYGGWGNRLRVSASPDPNPLVRTRIRLVGGIVDPTHVRLDSATGVERGTILSLATPLGEPIDTPFKVIDVDRRNDYLLTLNTALPAAAVNGSAVVSQEFRLDVLLLRQPDPAQPSRNSQVIDQESFRSLSLDPRHSRYVHRVIGTTWTLTPLFVDDDLQPLRNVDYRSEGESRYIRVRDQAQDLAEPVRTAELASIRLGPEFLLDVLPDGRERPARFALADGDDQVSAILDSTYIGVDDVEPRERTGLHTLRNIEDISIVAIPGRTSAALQGALVAHCELMRYRFAVLDAHRPPADSLVDVQNQRQQFDTKYAALYHPWLIIPDPYPVNPAQPADYPVPPSGHVLGIYARTDIERGVHKAPANEVVRGVIGLARSLNKEQHDILNPFPVNINVIRDFRPNNRGIRVYGGRCITSDSDWKYVNVRRLLIFIEASIDRGLQWVVFEPNAEPLWARVRRSVANFLTLVWRNGGLEGATVEEAFFVKCDRTTMTQTDIDSGRLICLVGVAPVKPAEFVIVRIGLWTAHADE